MNLIDNVSTKNMTYQFFSFLCVEEFQNFQDYLYLFLNWAVYFFSATNRIIKSIKFQATLVLNLMVSVMIFLVNCGDGNYRASEVSMKSYFSCASYANHPMYGLPRLLYVC